MLMTLERKTCTYGNGRRPSSLCTTGVCHWQSTLHSDKPADCHSSYLAKGPRACTHTFSTLRDQSFVDTTQSISFLHPFRPLSKLLILFMELACWFMHLKLHGCHVPVAFYAPRNQILFSLHWCWKLITDHQHLQYIVLLCVYKWKLGDCLFFH